MDNVTLLEAAKHSGVTLDSVVTRMIVENSPVLEYLTMRTIQGPAFRYTKEQRLGDVAYRGVNQTYTRDAGVILPEFEALVILGGEVFVDNFEVEVMSNVINLKSEKYKMKARSVGIKFSEMFFEGDTAVDPYGIDGLRKRITGGQLLTGTTANGDKLSASTMKLAKIDELLDAVVGDNSGKVLWMNAACRRAITELVRVQTGSSLITFTQDSFGRQQTKYADATIRVVRREDDGSTILGFDETKGGSNVTCSIYCTRFGTDFIHGIQSKSLPSVKDFGEIEAAPGHLGRIEWFNGLVVRHPRAAARLYGILAE